MKKLLTVLISLLLSFSFVGAAQHDLEITSTDANTGPMMRTQINAALLALGTLQVGTVEPSRATGINYAYMLWADTTNNKLKMRNSSDTDWIIIGNLNTEYLGLMPINVAQTITVQHTFNPTSALPPFILGANAQGQLVTGLNADKVDGYEAAALANLAGNQTFTGVKTFQAAPVLQGPAWPAFSVHRNAVNQTIPASTNTKVEFTTESWDTNNNFDSTTNYRFTPTVEGYYLLIGMVKYDGPFAGTNKIMRAIIYKNGSEHKESQRIKVDLPGADSVPVEAIVYANGISDYFELYTYHTDSAAKDIFGSSVYTYFIGIRIG